MTRAFSLGAAFRRHACVLATVALVAAGCSAPDAGKKTGPVASGTAVPAKPSSPQTLNILDVAGNLQLTQEILDNFQKDHPEVVSKIITRTAAASEVPARIKAEQDAGHLGTDLVLTGTDALAAGIAQGTWRKVTPTYDTRLPALRDVYTEDAAKMQELAQGYGVVVTEYPAGPLMMYNPKTVPIPPATAAELLAYAKAHPGKVAYAQPRNSWPARAMLMGLPYVLGDKDPRNPQTWDKTWAYLAEMAPYNPPYPGSTGQTVTDLAGGTVDIIATTTGWDINPRALGTVPAEMKISQLKGFRWITDAHYMVVPKGIDKDKLSAILNLIKFALQPKEQAITYDQGYFYPGPAVKGVTIDMAPPKSQDTIRQFGRPEYDDLIKNTPKETSLPAEAQVKAYDLWDQKVGSVAKK
ncbi:MAG TPA: extracellular solute-binding protein [Planosporangium sp.]|nr:extracellular solute-binding protein [Planosporangium sp.]